MTARSRALLKSILVSVEDAYAEACKDNNLSLISHLEEALELVRVLFGEYDEDEPQELDF